MGAVCLEIQTRHVASIKHHGTLTSHLTLGRLEALALTCPDWRCNAGSFIGALVLEGRRRVLQKAFERLVREARPPRPFRATSSIQVREALRALASGGAANDIA